MLFALKRKTAEEVARCVNFVFRIFGAPAIVQADNGGEFKNKIMKDIMKGYGVRYLHGRPYHPEVCLRSNMEVTCQPNLALAGSRIC